MKSLYYWQFHILLQVFSLCSPEVCNASEVERRRSFFFFFFSKFSIKKTEADKGEKKQVEQSAKSERSVAITEETAQLCGIPPRNRGDSGEIFIWHWLFQSSFFWGFFFHLSSDLAHFRLKTERHRVTANYQPFCSVHKLLLPTDFWYF